MAAAETMVSASFRTMLVDKWLTPSVSFAGAAYEPEFARRRKCKIASWCNKGQCPAG
jgi:hypothetical protein